MRSIFRRGNYVRREVLRVLSLVEAFVASKRRDLWLWTPPAATFLVLFLVASPRAYTQSCSGTGTGGCVQVSCPNGVITCILVAFYLSNGTFLFSFFVFFFLSSF